MAESISDVIRGAASVTVVVAVSWTVRFRNAEVVLARVATGQTAGRALHKVVCPSHGPLVRQRNVLVDVEWFPRPVAVSWEAPHGSRLLIVGGLPLQRRRQVVREIVQLLRRQLGQRTERVDLSLERQLADVHEPVAVVVLPMDAQRRTNAIAERSGRERILLREDLDSLVRES